MPNLYPFSKLETKLKLRGIKVYHDGGYRPIIKELSIDEQLYNIRFTYEGVIFTDAHGREWLGFVYKKHFAFYKGGKNNSPRMHLCHCGVTDTWGKEAYMFANTLPITVYNSSDNDRPKQLTNIKMCGNCIPIRRNRGWLVYKDAKEYINYIKQHYKIEETRMVDYWGYTKDWWKVRKDYIQKHNYTCEVCGRRFNGVFLQSCLYVYHKDRELSNNNEANLQCLCVDCYMKAYLIWNNSVTDIKSQSLRAFFNGEIYYGYHHSKPKQLRLNF